MRPPNRYTIRHVFRAVGRVAFVVVIADDRGMDREVEFEGGLDAADPVGRRGATLSYDGDPVPPWSIQEIWLIRMFRSAPVAPPEWTDADRCMWVAPATEPRPNEASGDVTAESHEASVRERIGELIALIESSRGG